MEIDYSLIKDVKEALVNVEQASINHLAKNMDSLTIACTMYSLHTEIVNVIEKNFGQNRDFQLYKEALEIERMTK